MANLGEFGAAKQEADPNKERDTITLCGEVFPVADAPDPLAMLDFGEAAAAGFDMESPEGLAAIKGLIRGSIDEEDWTRFRAVVRRHRPSPAALMELAMAVVQREAGRPTEQPSDSSGGSSTTTQNSRELLSSAASSWRNSPFGKRELEAHPELYAEVVPLRDAAAQAALLTA